MHKKQSLPKKTTTTGSQHVGFTPSVWKEILMVIPLMLSVIKLLVSAQLS
jgi:hypothetical protein